MIKYTIVAALLCGAVACDPEGDAERSRVHAYLACRGMLASAHTAAETTAVFRQGVGMNDPGGYICAEMVGSELARRDGSVR